MLTSQHYLKGRHLKFAHEFSDEKKKSSAKMVARASELLSAFGKKREVHIGWTPLDFAKRDGLERTSPHVYGQAIALLDFDKKLGHWAIENLERLVELELYMQSLVETHVGDFPFVRFQLTRPKCGSRIFSNL